MFQQSLSKMKRFDMTTTHYMIGILTLLVYPLVAQESVELAIGKADAVVDLRTPEGTGWVKAQWKYSDASLQAVTFQAPGPAADDTLALYPTGPEISTYDLFPKAGEADFDDTGWEILDPASLEHRRGTGLLSFNWYRLHLTIPERVGTFGTEGATVVFEIVVDDYAEIFVNGELQKTYGQSGGGVVKGWNARNRVTLTTQARPGETFQLAILGMNAPLADLPENYIWIRSATLDFYHQRPVNPDWLDVGQIVKIDSQLDHILDPNEKMEKVATGFQFTEGPAWHPEGFLVFSDPNTNVVYAYKPLNGNVEIYRSKSGYSGINIGDYHQPGSNGLAFDPQGRLTLCQHGNRQLVRIEKKGPLTTLAHQYEGKRLNSPNDLVYRSDGALFFTDPPYGLPKVFEDSAKETGWSGVYALIDQQLKLVSTDLKGPNGIAFSPDEKYLYVSNWDITDIHHTKVIMRYAVAPDGTLSEGITFFDMNQTDGEEALDGIKVDDQGNVFCAGPGGIWVISPEGNYLGRIVTPEHAANMAWGDDGRTLYITATSSIYKIRVKTGVKLPVNI